MERFIESIYGVISFYVIVTILSFAVAFKIKEDQTTQESIKDTYVASYYTASYNL